MKNFVKALNKEGATFKYLETKFPYVSDAKLKAGIFIGPQIRELMCDEGFEEVLTEVEAKAWFSFKKVAQNFLGEKAFI